MHLAFEIVNFLSETTQESNQIIKELSTSFWPTYNTWYLLENLVKIASLE